MKTITKRGLNKITHTSIDAFGRKFEIDTTSNDEYNFTLIAVRESFENTIRINYRGIESVKYMNTSSKKEFVECVFNAIS